MKSTWVETPSQGLSTYKSPSWWDRLNQDLHGYGYHHATTLYRSC